MIKKQIGLIAFAGILAACNSNAGKDHEAPETEDVSSIPGSKTGILETAVEEAPAETGPGKLIFKASGSEPGWAAEFYEHQLLLVTDYGKDTLVVKKEFKDLDGNSAYSLPEMKVEAATPKTLSLSISKTPCTAASGDKLSNTVVVTLNKKDYKGCGQPVH